MGFLSEHELPEKARLMDSGVEDASASTSGSSSSVPQPARSSGGGSGGNGGSSFPGGGNTLGSAPTPRVAPRPAVAQSRHPESAIEMIMGLGVSREVAISTLDAAGGNVDAAASLLF